MGKKRIVKKTGEGAGSKPRSLSRVPRKKVLSGKLYVESTYNNTKAQVTDMAGNALIWSSSGMLGFRGAKKGTPFAAAKVGELLGEKAATMGMKEAGAVIKGVGSGREAVVRGFMSKGIDIIFVKDATPVPHNGPKPKKPRRV